MLINYGLAGVVIYIFYTLLRNELHDLKEEIRRLSEEIKALREYLSRVVRWAG
jgi:hypothetical protein